MQNMDKELTVPKWVLMVRLTIIEDNSIMFNDSKTYGNVTICET